VFLPACGVPAAGRNQLADDFMKSGYDRLVFVDADVTFEVGTLMKIAHAKEPLVGGAYRFKIECEQYPILWKDTGPLWANENGLLEVRALPTGFLSISREVFEKLKAAKPRAHTHLGRTLECFFHYPFKEGHLFSEDTAFCDDWREIGGQVWLDPELTLTHWDFNRPYPGHIGKWLKSRLSVPAPKEQIA
jgi:choline kinase